MSGQVIWNSSADGSAAGKNYIVNPILEKNLAHVARMASNFGRMSRPMGEYIYMDNGRSVAIDQAPVQGCIWTKTMKHGAGDEVRFTLVENLGGAPTYGDAPVRSGDHLTYMNANMRINKIDSPAYPLQEEMQRFKVDDILGKEESEIRQQCTLWFGQEYAAEAIRAGLNGLSDAARAARTVGGLADPMPRGEDGNGNSKKCSPENVIILGGDDSSNGGVWLSPSYSTKAGYDDHELQIASKLNDMDTFIGTSATNAALSQPSRRMAFELREALSNKLFEFDGGPADMGGKIYIACDPAFMFLLQHLDNDVFALYKTAQNTGSEERKNLYRLPDTLELDNMVFFREPMLRYFRLSNADNAAKGIVGYGSDNPEFSWGSGKVGTDFRRNLPDYVGGAGNGARWGTCMILGRGALLEGTSGSMEVTEEKGEHGKGREIAMHQKFALKRRFYIPKDGRDVAPFNRNNGTILFRLPLNSKYGAM